jgi:hypothetical protein
MVMRQLTFGDQGVLLGDHTRELTPSFQKTWRR